MKTTSSTRCRFVILISLAAACALAPDLRADWVRFYPGMGLRALPVGCVQTSVGTTGFYYYDGVYFRPTTEGTYTVVVPPVGAVVPQLPNDAEAIVLGSDTYYYGGGAFYLPVLSGF